VQSAISEAQEESLRNNNERSYSNLTSVAREAFQFNTGMNPKPGKEDHPDICDLFLNFNNPGSNSTLYPSSHGAALEGFGDDDVRSVFSEDNEDNYVDLSSFNQQIGSHEPGNTVAMSSSSEIDSDEAFCSKLSDTS